MSSGVPVETHDINFQQQQAAAEELWSCPICFDDLPSSSAYPVGPCGHCLCLSCLERLLQDFGVEAQAREESAISLSRKAPPPSTSALAHASTLAASLALPCPTCKGMMGGGGGRGGVHTSTIGAAPTGWVTTSALVLTPLHPTPLLDAGYVALERAEAISTLLVSPAGGGGGGGEEAPLICPFPTCRAISVAPLPHHTSTTPSKGHPRECGSCSQLLCLDCGAPWEGGELPHTHFPTCAARAEEAAFRAASLLPPGEKLCPGCATRCTRIRYDACHWVSCMGCTLLFCFVCLEPQRVFASGEVPHHCPHTCHEDGGACNCEPEAIPGETPQQATDRRATYSDAVASHMAANPAWPGPRTVAPKPTRAVAAFVTGRNGGRGGGGAAAAVAVEEEEGDPGEEEWGNNPWPAQFSHQEQMLLLRQVRQEEEEMWGGVGGGGGGAGMGGGGGGTEQHRDPSPALTHATFSARATARAIDEGDGCTLLHHVRGIGSSGGNSGSGGGGRDAAATPHPPLTKKGVKRAWGMVALLMGPPGQPLMSGNASEVRAEVMLAALRQQQHQESQQDPEDAQRGWGGFSAPPQTRVETLFGELLRGDNEGYDDDGGGGGGGGGVITLPPSPPHPHSPYTTDTPSRIAGIWGLLSGAGEVLAGAMDSKGEIAPSLALAFTPIPLPTLSQALGWGVKSGVAAQHPFHFLRVALLLTPALVQLRSQGRPWSAVYKGVQGAVLPHIQAFSQQVAAAGAAAGTAAGTASSTATAERAAAATAAVLGSLRERDGRLLTPCILALAPLLAHTTITSTSNGGGGGGESARVVESLGVKFAREGRWSAAAAVFSALTRTTPLSHATLSMDLGGGVSLLMLGLESASYRQGGGERGGLTHAAANSSLLPPPPSIPTTTTGGGTALLWGDGFSDGKCSRCGCASGVDPPLKGEGGPRIALKFPWRGLAAAASPTTPATCACKGCQQGEGGCADGPEAREWLGEVAGRALGKHAQATSNLTAAIFGFHCEGGSEDW